MPKSARPPAPLDAAIGRAVRCRREQANISQERLAELAGLHRTYISLLERGWRSPTLDSMARLAAALGVAIADLVGDAEASLTSKQETSGKDR